MYDLKKIKYVLLVSAIVMLFSNFAALRATLLLKKPVETPNITQDDTYKDRYIELSRENEALKQLVQKLEETAHKWNLFEQRYKKSSRGSTDKDSHIISNSVKKRMRVTAYTEYECDKDPDHPEFRITTSGNEVAEWFTAAAGPELPFGTRIYVPYFKDCENNGIFVVEDRGGAIKENCIDIYVTDQEAAKEFGCKWMDVYIIND